ncbi:MAG: SdpI family protein [Nanoarchaeota archaeon]|nr:SdpI family protein [Nanoarchaeota archaeon]
MKKKEFLPWALIIVLFITAFYVYPSMPDVMPTHWNAKGEVDGYSSRLVGVFLMPVMAIGIYLLLFLVPSIAVFKENVKEFEPYYYWFRVAFVAFMGFIYVSSLMPNFGFKFNMTRLVMPAIGALFFLIGFAIHKVKRNYFIGIRTPWTLSSDYVWKKTHEKGSRLFMALGVIALLISFLPEVFWGFMVFVFAFVIWCFVYSYLVFQEELKSLGKKKK